MQIPKKPAHLLARWLGPPMCYLAASLPVGALFGSWANAAEEVKPTEGEASSPAEASAPPATKDQVAPPPIPPDPNDALLVPDLLAIPAPEPPRFRASRRGVQ